MTAAADGATGAQARQSEIRQTEIRQTETRLGESRRSETRRAGLGSVADSLDDEGDARPGPALARYGGVDALAAAALALFAPAAALVVTLADGVGGAGPVALAMAALASAPLAATAAVALARPLPGGRFALALAPIPVAAAGAAWFGGGLLSPLAPWIFAALAAAALLGGRRATVLAALGGAALAIALLLAPEPPLRLGGFATRDDRALALTLSWIAALACLAATAWAALGAWAEALPALRRPTIAARRALAALADAGGLCALRIDGRGRVTQAVGAAEGTLEMTREAMIGLTLTDLAHPDDREAIKAMLRAARRGRADQPEETAAETARATSSGTAAQTPAPRSADAARAATLVVRMRSRFGGYRWVEAAAAQADAFPAPASAPQGASGAVRDVMLTVRARWRSERDLGRGPDSGDAEVLAHVNSALRDGLKSVVGYTEILKNELFGPIGSERYRDYARRAHEGGADLLELVDELLDLAEIEAGRYGARQDLVDPVPVIDGALRLLATRAERGGVELTADAPPSTPHVRIDRRALRRVLVNMVSDAVRSAEMGDRITLRARAEEGAIEFRVTAVRGASRPAAADAAAPQQPSAASRATPGSDAQLGRMVAANLAERLGGSLVFSESAGRAAEPGVERLYAEAILPLGAAPRRIDDDAATDASAARGAGGLWGSDPDSAPRRAAREASEARDLARPLFDFDGEDGDQGDDEAKDEDAAGRAGPVRPGARPAALPPPRPSAEPDAAPARLPAAAAAPADASEDRAADAVAPRAAFGDAEPSERDAPPSFRIVAPLARTGSDD